MAATPILASIAIWPPDRLPTFHSRREVDAGFVSESRDLLPQPVHLDDRFIIKLLIQSISQRYSHRGCHNQIVT